MFPFLRLSGAAVVATAFAAFAPGAVAQEKDICQSVGSTAPEPVGDREGHAIQVDMISCRVEGGALAGGITTGQDIWEWDKTNAKMVSVTGLVRKAGATAAYELTDGTIALTLADGKVTGFTATGKGRYQLATGSAASLAGKTFTFTAKPTGAGQWETDVTADVAAQ
jgi:hypothetical protein